MDLSWFYFVCLDIFGFSWVWLFIGSFWLVFISVRISGWVFELFRFWVKNCSVFLGL